MTKKHAIAARDHRAGIPEQRFDCVACGGLLPVVAIERANAKYDLRDLLLRRAIAIAIDALQHPSQPCALLFGQPCFGRNGPLVERGEQALDGLKPVEPLDAERHERTEGHAAWFDVVMRELQVLPVAEIVEE